MTDVIGHGLKIHGRQPLVKDQCLNLLFSVWVLSNDNDDDDDDDNDNDVK